MFALGHAVEPPDGFQGAAWGASPAEVRAAAELDAWRRINEPNDFPPAVGITTYSARTEIAGYPATVKYYFFGEKFFQATIAFDFSNLENFDFNYNVFISVDRYYRAIHDQTIT
ncbi:MAG: hypothetical protein GF363_18020, partial [Chitinivibrionales bacterium]|nr:hypothetical protein [Chitinivibrionales bacterium]